MAVPTIIKFLTDKNIKATSVDFIMLVAVSWQSLSIIINHGISEIPFAGSIFVELFFAYFLARVFIRSAEDYRFFLLCFFSTLVVFLPFALIEAFTYNRILRNIFSTVLVQSEDQRAHRMIRFGILRVRVSFDHAILFGMFCSVSFINFYYSFKGRLKIFAVILSGFMIALSVSSSALLAVAIQITLAIYERVFRWFPAKWVVAAAGSVIVWYSFEFLFETTPVDYLVNELVFNTYSAMARVDQIIYGIKEIERNPIFGIGLNPIALPFWWGNVIDNYWLLLAIRSGIPALLIVMIAFFWHMLRICLTPITSEQDSRVRLGYCIALFTLLLVLASVTIWGIALAFVYLYVGAGAWFYDKQQKGPSDDRRRLSPSRRAFRSSDTAISFSSNVTRPTGNRRSR